MKLLMDSDTYAFHMYVPGKCIMNLHPYVFVHYKLSNGITMYINMGQISNWF